MIEKILDITGRRRAAAEVFQAERLTVEVTFEAGKLKTAERKTLLGAGLRVIHEGRLGFAATSDLSRVEDLVENAFSAARFGKEAGFTFPGPSASEARASFDPKIEAYTPAEAVAEGKRAIEDLRGCCPKALTDVSLAASVTSVRLANSAGMDSRYRTTDFRHSITSVIVEGDSILWVAEGGEYGVLDLRTDEYVGKIAERARHAATPAPKVSGKLPVLFTAQELPNLLQSVELGVNGRRMVKGDSPLIGREGERVLGDVTLVDDPFRADAPGSRPFDDEGVASQRTVLFENGVFRSFLFDLDTGAQAGCPSTGNAGRGMLSAPSVAASNLVMTPGEADPGEMVRSLREGIVIHGVLGGGQSNLLAGDFALNVMLGFLIRDGEIAGRLVDTMIAGNVYDAFTSIAAMGREVKPVGSHFLPDVLFSELSVSSR